MSNDTEYHGAWRPRALACGTGPASATKEYLDGVLCERDDAGYEHENGDWPWLINCMPEEETLP